MLILVNGQHAQLFSETCLKDILAPRQVFHVVAGFLLQRRRRLLVAIVFFLFIQTGTVWLAAELFLLVFRSIRSRWSPSILQSLMHVTIIMGFKIYLILIKLK